VWDAVVALVVRRAIAPVTDIEAGPYVDMAVWAGPRRVTRACSSIPQHSVFPTPATVCRVWSFTAVEGVTEIVAATSPDAAVIPNPAIKTLTEPKLIPLSIPRAADTVGIRRPNTAVTDRTTETHIRPTVLARPVMPTDTVPKAVLVSIGHARHTVTGRRATTTNTLRRALTNVVCRERAVDPLPTRVADTRICTIA
jgi:hypothetical protein